MDLRYYKLKKLSNGRWDYLIYVEYETREDLENTVYDIFSEMNQQQIIEIVLLKQVRGVKNSICGGDLYHRSK